MIKSKVETIELNEKDLKDLIMDHYHEDRPTSIEFYYTSKSDDEDYYAAMPSRPCLDKVQLTWRR